MDIFQMSSVANADHSGVFAALIPGTQGLGQIVGPNIAASLLDADQHGDLRCHVLALAKGNFGAGGCFVSA